jgi:hypothetical protein
VLPPIIEPTRLAGKIRKPSIAELRDVLDLHHFARCLESKYRSISHNDMPYHQYYDSWRHPASIQPPEPADDSTASGTEGQDVWRENFDTAVYTSLLLGAILSRAHNLPFFSKTASPARLRLLERFREYPSLGFNGRDLSQLEVNYLVQNFAPYDLLGTLTRQEVAFNSAADWFVQAALEELENSPPGPPSDVLTYQAFQNKERKLFNISRRSRIWPWDRSLSSRYIRHGAHNNEGEAVFAETMRAIEMMTFLLRCAITTLDVPAWPRPGIRSADYNPPTRMRTAKVVLLGIFRPEKIQMPYSASDSSSGPLVARQVESQSPVSDISGVLGWLHIVLTEDPVFSGAYYPPDSWTCIPTPPTQFFAFLLRKYFRLRLEQVGIDRERWQHF